VTIKQLDNLMNCIKWNICGKLSSHIDTVQYLEKLSENDPFIEKINCFDCANELIWLEQA
jgi:hypothetical protein